jgi:hypothetical protein
MLDDAEECQLSGPIGELMPFTSRRQHRGTPPFRRPSATSLAAACSADSSTSTTSWPRSPSGSLWRLIDTGRRPRSCANDHRVRQRGATHHQYWLTSQRAPLRGLGNSPDQTPASHAECLQRDRGFGALHLRHEPPLTSAYDFDATSSPVDFRTSAVLQRGRGHPPLEASAGAPAVVAVHHV